MKRIFCMVSLLFIMLPSCTVTDTVDDTPEFSGQMVFTTTGSEFSPIITVDESQNPVILWTFADVTTDNTAAPSKDYGTEAERENILQINPWSALIGINIGYDAGDGGDAYDNGEHGPQFEAITLLAPQNVTGVTGLENAAGSLQFWSSAGPGNDFALLDFSDFSVLERIECIGSHVSEITLSNNTALERLCLEAVNMAETLDLTGCPNLGDLRGAGNPYTEIIFGNTVNTLWHLCVNSAPNLANPHMYQDLTVYPNVTELLVFNSQQSGEVTMSSSTVQYAQYALAENAYTSADFEGAFQMAAGSITLNISTCLLETINLAGCVQVQIMYLQNNLLENIDISDCYRSQIIDLSGNRLTELDVSGLTDLWYLNLSDNELTQTSVDTILETLDSLGLGSEDYPDVTVNLGGPGNSAPSPASAANITNLEAGGWTVTVN